jgi:hypothetical protein
LEDECGNPPVVLFQAVRRFKRRVEG